MDTLGIVLMKKGLWTSAIRELRSAVDRAPQDATIHFHLAEALAGSGQTDEARSAATRALKINPNLPEAAQAKKILATPSSRQSSRE
jgi:Flp pilus assembly protein TadD